MTLGDEASQPDSGNGSTNVQLQRALIRILIETGVGPAKTAALLQDWITVGGSFQAALIAGGEVDESAFYALLARNTGFRFLDEIESDRLVPYRADLIAALRKRDSERIVLYAHRSGEMLVLISPDLNQIEALTAFRVRHPVFARNLCFVPPRILRRRMLRASEQQMTRLAVDRLFVARPDFSARRTGALWQGVVPGLSLLLFPYGLWKYPGATLLALHLLAAIFFLSCIVLRLLAVSKAGMRYPARYALQPADQMPVYSVVVALYREANVVGDLIVALSKLRWPRSRLEIKLVCEADDNETIEAILAHRLSSIVEIIAVPPGLPRTKPKAITYALPAVTGDFVVLYDAEDRPHPDQLLEAWHRFRSSDGKLACLQAPLVVSNWRTNFLTRMFAFEYAALFRGLLPWLAHKNLFFPLGGTSNHFRRSILEPAGAWDPFNVTEDADLALRLTRLGYRSGLIDCPTLEDAPDDLGVWFKQRTRWMKGWMQCLTVHNRNLKETARDLGAKNYIVSQIIFAGVVFSSLLHPLLIVYVAGFFAKIVYSSSWNALTGFLFVLDVVNLTIAYLSFFLLGRRAVSKAEAGMVKPALVSIPAYWLLMSAAAWRALFQLVRAPHLWEKTPHRRAMRHAVASVRRPASTGRRRR